MAGSTTSLRKWPSLVLANDCRLRLYIWSNRVRTEKPVIAVGCHFDRLISKYKSWPLPLPAPARTASTATRLLLRRRKNAVPRSMEKEIRP